MPEYLSSDDILLNDATLGRCWGCAHIGPLAELTEVPIDTPGHVQSLCEDCLEQEAQR